MPSALLATVAAFLVALLGFSRTAEPAVPAVPTAEAVEAAAERVALREVVRLAALAPEEGMALADAETWTGEPAGDRVVAFRVATRVHAGADGAATVAEVTVAEVVVGEAARAPVVLTAPVRLAPR